MNIKYFLAALCAAAIFVSCEREKTAVLFNGKDLSGWKAVLKSTEGETFDGETFSVRDSVLKVEIVPLTTRADFFLVIGDKRFNRGEFEV